MGIIAKVLSFTRLKKGNDNVSDVKADPGGGANLTGEHFSSPGDDSFPLESDLVFLVDTLGNGNINAVGYLDPLNQPKANLGEKRIYARKSDGSIACEIWLKNDGSIVVNNGFGKITMESSGDINLNGAIIDTNGKITAPKIEAETSLKVASSELLGHVHGGVSPGSSSTLPLI